jgi:hypothetical protein
LSCKPTRSSFSTSAQMWANSCSGSVCGATKVFSSGACNPAQARRQGPVCRLG